MTKHHFQAFVSEGEEKNQVTDYPAEGNWLNLKVVFAAAYLTWDQALFLFLSVNDIPAGRENVWEPLKLGVISGYSLLL